MTLASQAEQNTKSAMPKNILVDEGIELRQLSPADSEVIYEMLEQSPDIRWYVELFQNSTTQLEVQSVIESQLDAGHPTYGIVENGKLVGYMGMHIDPSVTDAIQYNISYFLAADARGQGVITRSLRKLLIESEKSLNVNRFKAWAEEGNEASAAVLLNLGFTAAQTPYVNNRGRTCWDYTRDVLTD